MPRKLFDREINDLIHRMTDLGNDVDGRIQMTIDALRTLDIEKAKKVATSDNEKMCIRDSIHSSRKVSSSVGIWVP